MMREMIIEELKNRGYNANSSDVTKNGVLFHGVTIGDGNIRPTIYVDNYSDRTDLDNVVDEIIELYTKSLNELPDINTSDLMNWDYAKTHLQLCLQKKGIENIVKRDFLDLEKFVRVIVTNKSNGTASFKVKPEHLKLFGITEDELFDTAFECTKEDFIIEDMLDIMIELMNIPESEIDELKEEMKDTPPQIVVSNKSKTNGASAICDTELLCKIADKYGTDLAILPSSIHECILIPIQDDVINFIQLDAMVRDVNANEVSPEEVLSDHAYRFIRDQKRIV